MAYESLNNSETKTATSLCGGRILAAGAARLYIASSKSWSHYATGAALLVDDTAVGSKFIRLVDLTNQSVTFEQELYDHFDYSASRPFFHVFETDSAVAGLSFASEKDAGAFLDVVHHTGKASVTRSPPPVPSKESQPQRSAEHKPPLPDHKPPPVPGNSLPPIPTKKPPPPPPVVAVHESPALAPPMLAHSDSHVNAPVSPSTTTSRTSSQPVLQPSTSSGKLPKQQSSGFFASLFGSKQEVEVPISAPTAFRHESHVGWDPVNGFEIRNIPADWKKLFSAAGIKKSELKNPETSKFILETVAVAVMEKEAPSGPPVHPTAATAAAHHSAPSTPLPKPPPPRPPPPADAALTPGGPGESTKQTSPRPAAPPPLSHSTQPSSPRPPPPPPPHAPTAGGPPPPPPPAFTHSSGGPPPPPPHTAPGGPPPPKNPALTHSPNNSRGDLLSQIKLGKELKKADLPELSTMKQEDKNSLVNTLASAMQARRQAIGNEETGDDDDGNWDD